MDPQQDTINIDTNDGRDVIHYTRENLQSAIGYATLLRNACIKPLMDDIHDKESFRNK